MTDIPILFSAAMVRALIDGRKTMTRRLAWRKPNARKGSLDLWATPWRKVKVGDRLWVRENFRVQQVSHVAAPDGGRLLVCVDYTADGTRIHHNIPANDATRILTKRGRGTSGEQTVLLPGIHLPRVVSRLTLIVTASKVETLHALTMADAIAEGIAADAPLSAFPDLWNRLHGKGAWDLNPEVVAISFQVIKANIDAPEARMAACSGCADIPLTLTNSEQTA